MTHLRSLKVSAYSGARTTPVADGTIEAGVFQVAGGGTLAALPAAEAAITDASEAHALNAVFDDTEVEAALNALGVKVNAILDALRALGFVTP